jgi:hypothetical protein
MPADRRQAGEELACDFCGRPGPAWYYPIREFGVQTGPLTWASGDRWYACEPCSALIEADEWAALAGRTLAHPLVVRVVWAAFRASRTGPRITAGCSCAPARTDSRCPVHGRP